MVFPPAPRVPAVLLSFFLLLVAGACAAPSPREGAPAPSPAASSPGLPKAPREVSQQELTSGPHGVIRQDLVDSPVPDFRGETVDGLEVSPSKARGKVLIIDLWGVNCMSCLDSMKALEEIYRDLGSRGLEIWAVNTEDLDPESIAIGLRRVGVSVTYTLMEDPGREITGLFTSWFIPVTVVVDKAGIVKYYKVGFSKGDETRIRELVEGLL